MCLKAVNFTLTGEKLFEIITSRTDAMTFSFFNDIIR